MRRIKIKLFYAVISIAAFALILNLHLKVGELQEQLNAITDSSVFMCGMQIDDDGSLYRSNEDD